MKALNAAKEILGRAVARVRSWIRTNMTGEAGSDFSSPAGKQPQSVDDTLQSLMDDTEFIPPQPLTNEAGVNRKAVEFWVNKLFDLLGSGIMAAFVWLLSPMPVSLFGRHAAKRSMPAL